MKDEEIREAERKRILELIDEEIEKYDNGSMANYLKELKQKIQEEK